MSLTNLEPFAKWIYGTEEFIDNLRCNDSDCLPAIQIVLVDESPTVHGNILICEKCWPNAEHLRTPLFFPIRRIARDEDHRSDTLDTS